MIVKIYRGYVNLDRYHYFGVTGESATDDRHRKLELACVREGSLRCDPFNILSNADLGEVDSVYALVEKACDFLDGAFSAGVPFLDLEGSLLGWVPPVTEDG